MRAGRLIVGPSPRRQIPWRILVRVLLALAIAGVLIVRGFYLEIVRVRGNLMGPAVLNGDLVLVARRTPPEVGDVVVVELAGQTVFRRVLASAGDRVSVVDGVLHRNAVPLELRLLDSFAYLEPAPEPEGPNDTTGEPERPWRQHRYIERFPDGRAHLILGDHLGAARPWLLELPEVEVPPGHLYVLCDNRRQCPLDERSGPVPIAAIRGVARVRVLEGDARYVDQELGETSEAQRGFEPLGSRSESVTPTSEAPLLPRK